MNNERSSSPPFQNFGHRSRTLSTGYGIISIDGHFYEPLDFGCIRPPPRYFLSERYLIIHDSIDELIERHKPSVLVVENQFMHKNAQSALKLGMARGVAMIAAKKHGLSIYGYSPAEAKRAVVGNGEQVKSKYKAWCKDY